MPTATRKQSRDIKRQETRTMAATQRRLAMEDLARRQEIADEAIAPEVQRMPVLDASGEVLRAARVERDGIVYVRSNPLAWLQARMEKGESKFKPEHLAAAKRLVTTWESVGIGVNPAGIDLGMPRATRSRAPMTPPGHKALLSQVTMQRELYFVYNYMHGLYPMWSCLHGVVIRGLSPTSWAQEEHLEPKTVSGILWSSLVLLARIYDDLDPPTPASKHRLRTWTTGARSKVE